MGFRFPCCATSMRYPVVRVPFHATNMYLVALLTLLQREDFHMVLFAMQGLAALVASGVCCVGPKPASYTDPLPCTPCETF